MTAGERLPIIGLVMLFAAGRSAVLGQQSDRRVSPVDSGRRMALVIGNGAYSSLDRLVNPINDARAVAATIKSIGFADRDVHLLIDAPRDEMRRSVRGFVESVKRGDLAFVYYAGHGVEVKGANYLLPVDVPRDATEGYVEDEAVSAQRLLRDLDDQGARVRVLILDACRDNPLRRSRSAGGGLVPMEGRGSLVVFSTEAGRTAADTPGQANSVFTQYLLQGLRQPGVSLDDAMKRVSRNVARATNERQVPAIYGLLLDDVILLPAAGTSVSSSVPSSISAPIPTPAPPSAQKDAPTLAARILDTNIFRLTQGDFTAEEWADLAKGTLNVKRPIHTERVFLTVDAKGLTFLQLPPHPGPLVVGETLKFQNLNTIPCGSLAKTVSMPSEATLEIGSARYISSRDVNAVIRSLIGSNCGVQVP